MKKAWCVAGIGPIALLILIGCGWKYATRDPLRKTFGMLKVGMSREQVAEMLAASCRECEMDLDEDSDGTIYHIFWNHNAYVEPPETPLIAGFSTTYANSSRIWLEYENGLLKNAERKQVSLFYLNLPERMHWKHLHRGYTIEKKECLTENCKQKMVQGGIITYDEHADWQRVKDWLKKMDPRK